MTYTTDQFDVVVIGAGIGGLTCGYQLAGSGMKVLVAERKGSVGGVIRSERQNGYLLEIGPNSFSTASPVANAIVEELGLTGRMQKRLLSDHARFVWRNQRLSEVPTSLGQFVNSDLLSLTEKLQLAAGLFKSLPSPEGDCEAGDYFRDRIGEGAVEAMLKPAVAGIYAADVDSVSLEATFPKIYDSARRHGTLLGVLKGVREAARTGDNSPRAPRALSTFDDGLQTLPNALAERIAETGGEVVTGVGARVSRCGDGDGRWSVELSDGRTVRSDFVVLGTSAAAAAELLRDVSIDAAQVFASVDYAPLAIVHVGVREDQLWEKRDGFGFLTTRGSQIRMLGMIWNDRMFSGRAPEGYRLMTCFYGGEIDPAAVGLSDSELESTVRDDFKLAMGMVGNFHMFRISRWKRAIPLYRVGHTDRIRAAVAKLPSGLKVLGSYTGDPSMPGRMTQALETAETILREAGTLTPA